MLQLQPTRCNRWHLHERPDAAVNPTAVQRLHRIGRGLFRLVLDPLRLGYRRNAGITINAQPGWYANWSMTDWQRCTMSLPLLLETHSPNPKSDPAQHARACSPSVLARGTFGQFRYTQMGTNVGVENDALQDRGSHEPISMRPRHAPKRRSRQPGCLGTVNHVCQHT